MAYQVMVAELAFQPIDPDDPTVQTGPEEMVPRFGEVPDYAPPYLISALLQCGAITMVADAENAPIREDAAPVLPNPEIPPGPEVGPIVVAPAVTSKPKVTDSKDAWENYAASPAVGMDRAEAESLSKPKLISEVNRREDERSKPVQPVSETGA